ncbi:MAG: acylneuraminate cytidylyltransferase family protein [Candidatus Omnitrophica bacterium]|nr:acylneuraminate cytidylyltransferase family protein [Candidatus Omnitrophota bacterium]
MKNKNIIAIIPARGGSKGIPGKNIMPFCGKPLIAWTILQAKASQYIRKVYVSSDSEEILQVSEKFGAKGIKRPDFLATDTASSESALLHALDVIEKESDQKIDLVVFLQLTSPLREPADLDKAIETLIAQQADSLFTAALLEGCSIWKQVSGKMKSFSFNHRKRMRRQDTKPLYLENGSIYVFKPSLFKKIHNRTGGKIAVFFMDFWKSHEIDTKEDVEICEYFMKKNLLKKKR